MRRLAHSFVVLLLTAVLAAPLARAQGGSLAGMGVVLLHGKGGAPGAMMEGLEESLKKAGAIVESPELPWSHNRIYDATYEQAMAEIDLAVQKARWRGANRIAVVGHSLGANAAIGYAARRDGLAAVVALAPGHLPEAWALRLRTSGAIAKAKAMIAEGKGDVRMSFPDLAQGIPFQVTATPNVYLSMFDPDGPAPMPKNAALMPAIPFLWVVGVADPIFFHGRDYVFELAARNPKSKYVVIAGAHLSTPFQARGTVVDWLKSL